MSSERLTWGIGHMGPREQLAQCPTWNGHPKPRKAQLCASCACLPQILEQDPRGWEAGAPGQPDMGCGEDCRRVAASGPLEFPFSTLKRAEGTSSCAT